MPAAWLQVLRSDHTAIFVAARHAGEASGVHPCKADAAAGCFAVDRIGKLIATVATERIKGATFEDVRRLVEVGADGGADGVLRARSHWVAIPDLRDHVNQMQEFDHVAIELVAWPDQTDAPSVNQARDPVAHFTDQSVVHVLGLRDGENPLPCLAPS